MMGHVVNNFKIPKIRYENCGRSSSISCSILKAFFFGNRLSYVGHRTQSFSLSRSLSGYDFKLSL